MNKYNRKIKVKKDYTLEREKVAEIVLSTIAIIGLFYAIYWISWNVSIIN